MHTDGNAPPHYLRELVGRRLRKLINEDGKRSNTARLRDVFDDVEYALRAGVKQIDVLDALRESGFQLTLTSFKSAVQRIRRQRRLPPSETALRSSRPAAHKTGKPSFEFSYQPATADDESHLV
jgi:hypothetical protein